MCNNIFDLKQTKKFTIELLRPTITGSNGVLL